MVCKTTYLKLLSLGFRALTTVLYPAYKTAQKFMNSPFRGMDYTIMWYIFCHFQRVTMFVNLFASEKVFSINGKKAKFVSQENKSAIYKKEKSFL